VSETVVLLHGFGGTHRAWDGVVERLDGERYRPLALDLPGHGEETAHPRPITFEACVEHVLASAPERFVLCGYSMGGRVALHLALAAPERVSRLVLVACSPGIEEPVERAARRRDDERLAGELESGPYEDFIESWRTQPLFADDPPEVGRLAREDQRRNDPLALAAVMRGLGTGTMQSLWGRLRELAMPVSFLAGARDEKFCAIGERMAQACRDCRLIVVAGGHALPLERPDAVVAVLQEDGRDGAGAGASGGLRARGSSNSAEERHSVD
jgi:2-succinyl-6-hydroxy-2,4-cyclohexadiene-1-carboxylate synthase